MAHEIGHNLGMYHDFNGSPSSPRSCRSGESCKGIGGIMDYTNSRVRWSCCSVQDFNDYYNSVVNNLGKFCMPTSKLD